MSVTGMNFIEGSRVQWNGVDQPTTFVRSTQLVALISAGDVATPGVGNVTVVNPGDGAGGRAIVLTSNPYPFYVTQPNARIVSQSTTTSTNPTAKVDINPSAGTGTATAVTATATGSGTLSVAIYDSDPSDTHSFASNDSFVDVHVAPGNNFASLTIDDCYLNGGTQVYWWNGNTWLLASHQTFNASTGCVRITVTSSSSPSLNDLTGTLFAAGKPVLAPDLIVQSIKTTANNIEVVIKNQGTAPIVDEFYVGLGIIPKPVPTDVNQIWRSLSQALIWGVRQSALPINPGGTVRLSVISDPLPTNTSEIWRYVLSQALVSSIAQSALPISPGETLAPGVGNTFYLPSVSMLPSTIPAGIWVYVQVDPANALTTYGAVRENHEIIDGPFNNISVVELASPVNIASPNAAQR